MITRHAQSLIDLVYATVGDNPEYMLMLDDYYRRHGVVSMLILTQYSQDTAQEFARLMAEDIDGKVVVEIGAGVGFLAIEMAKRAKAVFAIEASPEWSWVFTESLYKEKPVNLTWIFGAAQQVADFIKADVAVICTRSGIDDMKRLAEKMAPKVIMPFQDIPFLVMNDADNP